MSRNLVCAALGLLLASGASADWLVLKTGRRIETKGPWEQKGRLVRFTTPDGKLQSMRADEIDLEASKTATGPGEISRREALAEGRLVDLPTAEEPKLAAEPQQLGFGESLAQFIRDPNAPRVEGPRNLGLGSGRTSDAYGQTDVLYYLRVLAVCAVGESRVRAIEASVDRGEAAGISACYDGRRRASAARDTEDVDWCVAEVLAEALAAVLEPGVDPCEPEEVPSFENEEETDGAQNGGNNPSRKEKPEN